MKCSPISIRGERHSGTNALRTMISEACPCSPYRINAKLDYDGVLGWKHAAVIPESGLENILLLFVYRNVFSWLRHMSRDTYEAQYYDTRGPMEPSQVLPKLVTNSFPGGMEGDFYYGYFARSEKSTPGRRRQDSFFLTGILGTIGKEFKDILFRMLSLDACPREGCLKGSRLQRSS